MRNRAYPNANINAKTKNFSARLQFIKMTAGVDVFLNISTPLSRTKGGFVNDVVENSSADCSIHSILEYFRGKPEKYIAGKEQRQIIENSMGVLWQPQKGIKVDGDIYNNIRQTNQTKAEKLRMLNNQPLLSSLVGVDPNTSHPLQSNLVVVHVRSSQLIAAGQLEFSLFNMAEPHLLQLPKMEVNPIIAIANYIFDSTEQDISYYKKTALYASLVSTRNDGNHLSAEALTRCELSFSRHLINLPYYVNPHWDQLLTNYFGLLEDKAILFPVAALKGIDYLMTLSQKRLLLLCADKGSHQIDKVAMSEEPPLMMHGSFSFDVNFHLLEQYILLNGGFAKHTQHYTNGLHISMFILGEEINHYKETLQNFYDWIENFNSYDFFKIKKYLERMASSLNVEEILAFLRLSGWDEKIYTILSPYLKSYELSCSPEEKQAIQFAVEQVQEWQYSGLAQMRDNNEMFII